VAAEVLIGDDAGETIGEYADQSRFGRLRRRDGPAWCSGATYLERYRTVGWQRQASHHESGAGILTGLDVVNDSEAKDQLNRTLRRGTRQLSIRCCLEA
jgi:hypothetical protein